jgi:hypothetical protein
LSDDKKSVSLEKVEFLEAAEKEGDATGCILHNETSSNDKAVNIIDGGFHLFVPDMHDNGSSAINGNVLLAHLGSNNIQSTSDVTRYVLSAKYYERSEVGKPDDQKTMLGDGKTVGFYKVDPVSGARLAANSAYLELGASVQPACIMMFFEDTIAPVEYPTFIESLEPVEGERAVWHTLSGQRIEAPVKAGIYIRNGKKVVVK